MRVGFIGAGNMASAIIKGMAGASLCNDVRVYDIDPAKTGDVCKKFGANPCSSKQEISEQCDFIFFAVKPNVMKGVINDIKSSINRNAVIVSIAAGKTLSFIEDAFDFEMPVIRVMPNINALVGESMSALCRNAAVSDSAFQEVLRIFNSIGKAVELDEKYFNIFTGAAGSSPAFVYLFIDSIARACVKAGLDKKTSLKIAAQTALGSAKTVLDSEKHPWELIDMVCSPGGTTIEGVSSLLDDGFEGIVMRSVEKAINKGSKL